MQYFWYTNKQRLDYQTLRRLQSNIHGAGKIVGGEPELIATNTISFNPFFGIHISGLFVEETDPEKIEFTPQASSYLGTFLVSNLSTDIVGGNPSTVSLEDGILSEKGSFILGWFVYPGGDVPVTSDMLWNAPNLNQTFNNSIYDWSVLSGTVSHDEGLQLPSSSTVEIQKYIDKTQSIVLISDVNDLSINLTLNSLDTSLSIPTFTQHMFDVPTSLYTYIFKLEDLFKGYVTFEITSTSISTIKTIYFSENSAIRSEWLV